MREKLTALLPCAAVFAADFYLLPLLIRDTGVAMLVLLCVVPLIAFIASVAYGVRRGFSLLVPIAAMVLFFPTVFLYYNPSAWVYVIFYGLAALAGNGLGRIFYQKR